MLDSKIKFLRTVITITTIHIPKFLEGLCEDVRQYGHQDISILIIGDKKTPDGIEDYCRSVIQNFGVPIEYLSPDDQLDVLSSYPKLLDLFPWNTPDRIILGCMVSYLRGCERIIAVDDDNFTIPEYDFVGGHSVTGRREELTIIQTDGWFNVHEALTEKVDVPFYPRGFPWSKRIPASVETWIQTDMVVVNQGLVLGDPDIDAITRLANPINAVGMNPEYPVRFSLAPGTWSPFNFQNTSLCREMIPLYYRPRSTLRNADIWTSYLFNRLAQHFGDVISFGQPLVRQIRNKHNLWEDLEVEVVNNRATDDFVEIVRNTKLTEKTYFKALGELLTEAQKESELGLMTTAERGMIRNFFREYQEWYRVVSEIVK